MSESGKAYFRLISLRIKLRRIFCFGRYKYKRLFHKKHSPSDINYHKIHLGSLVSLGFIKLGFLLLSIQPRSSFYDDPNIKDGRPLLIVILFVCLLNRSKSKRTCKHLMLQLDTPKTAEVKNYVITPN